MEEPLHRLTSAAVLFSDVTAESTEGAELRMRGLSFPAQAICREAFRLFRLYHGHPPRLCRRRSKIREKTGLSQARFAELLGVSARTLQDWEQGRRAPSGAARTLLLIADRYPEILLKVA